MQRRIDIICIVKENLRRRITRINNNSYVISTFISTIIGKIDLIKINSGCLKVYQHLTHWEIVGLMKNKTFLSISCRKKEQYVMFEIGLFYKCE